MSIASVTTDNAREAVKEGSEILSCVSLEKGGIVALRSITIIEDATGTTLQKPAFRFLFYNDAALQAINTQVAIDVSKLAGMISSIGGTAFVDNGLISVETIRDANLLLKTNDSRALHLIIMRVAAGVVNPTTIDLVFEQF